MLFVFTALFGNSTCRDRCQLQTILKEHVLTYSRRINRTDSLHRLLSGLGETSPIFRSLPGESMHNSICMLLSMLKNTINRLFSTLSMHLTLSLPLIQLALPALSNHFSSLCLLRFSNKKLRGEVWNKQNSPRQ